MAHKRRMIVKKEEEGDVEAAPEEMGWKEWLLRRYLRLWYWLGILFLDIMVFFQLQRSFDLDWRAALAVTLMVTIVGMYLFLKLWGRDAPLGEKDDRDQ